MAEYGILLMFSLAPLACCGIYAPLAACYPWLLPLWHFYSQRRVKNTEKLGTVDRKGDM